MMAESVKRTLIPRGRVACRVDELSYDVPHNRVLKAAMRALIGLPSLDRNIRSGLNALCGRLGEVTDIDLTPSVFRRVQLHRNIARYSFLVNVAELVARSFVPDERTGKRRFRPFTASEQEMGLLFEGFVRNFLRREQDHFHVSARKIPWDIDVETSSDPAWMPEMRTDVMLSHTETRIALEAKYYASPYQRRHGTKKLISAHLYQLLTYLSQLRAIDGPDPMGVLLYAGAGEQQRLDYRIGDQPVLVRSLDLNREWREIHRDLLSIAEELKESR
jgi:5-methylcytosine-specific restriction enzyme subunit McrC